MIRVLESGLIDALPDRLLAGTLTDAVAARIAQHRVVERIAVQVLATAEPRPGIGAVLDHEITERCGRPRARSPGLERP